MKFWCVLDTCALKRVRGLAGAGLVVLAAMPWSHALAEDPAKPAAAAQEKAAQEKAAADKAVQEKTAADKAAQEKAAADKAVQEKTAADKAAQEKAAADKAAQEKAAAAKATAAAKAAALVPAECVRTGQRVIAALVRDDANAANQFFTFYNSFKCSQPHLAQSFACLVKFQTINPAISNPSPEVIKQCWDDPATLPKAPPPAPTPPPESH